MESDRAKQRLRATVDRMTRKRIEFYAAAEDVSVGTAAARLIRAGIKQHSYIDRERIECSRRVFNDNYPLPSAPREGEGVRLKIGLEDEEVSQVKKLAIREFETEATILNRLLLWGFHRVPYSHGHWSAWAAYYRDAARHERADG
jgi:hypothetical protein